MKFLDMVEWQILKVQVEGQFDNLKGVGKFLDVDFDGSVDVIGFWIMVEVGVLL